MYLERISDRSLQAAHPITLSVDTMARVLRGVAVKENRGFLGGLVGGKPEAVRVFKEQRTSGTWRHSWSRGSPELRRTSGLGFASFGGGADGINERFALRLRTVNVSELALANPRVPSTEPAGRHHHARSSLSRVGKTAGQLSRRALDRIDAGHRLCFTRFTPR